MLRRKLLFSQQGEESRVLTSKKGPISPNVLGQELKIALLGLTTSHQEVNFRNVVPHDLHLLFPTLNWWERPPSLPPRHGSLFPDLSAGMGWQKSGRRAQATASGKDGFRGLGGAGLKQGCAPRARMQGEGAAEFSLLISPRIEPE